MNRKHIYFGIASILLLILFIWGSYNVLKNETPYIPENTVSAMDNERSQVYVSGKDYNLETEVQKKHQETEQKRSKILEEQERNNTQNGEKTPQAESKEPKRKEQDQKRPEPEQVRPPQNNNDDDDDDDPDEREHYNKPEEERKLAPTISTDLVKGDKLKGENLDFTVKAKDHEGNGIPAFSNGQGKLIVTVNGKKATSIGGPAGKVKYRVKAKNGKNTVKITAYDRKGRTKTITIKVTVDTNEEKQKTCVASVKVKAPSIGKPNIMSTSVEFKEGDTVEEVVKAALKKKGFSFSWPSGYLREISKGGMISGWEISDEMMEYITERGAESKLVDPEKVDTGKLGENDIIKETGSGWNYSINGTFPGTGMGAVTASDGSNIEIVFSLFSDRGDLSH